MPMHVYAMENDRYALRSGLDGALLVRGRSYVSVHFFPPHFLLRSSDY